MRPGSGRGGSYFDHKANRERERRAFGCYQLWHAYLIEQRCYERGVIESVRAYLNGAPDPVNPYKSCGVTDEFYWNRGRARYVELFNAGRFVQLRRFYEFRKHRLYEGQR